jgi:nucleoside-diphosphate-sugar epimerase
MKFTVFGAEGFIGSHLVRHLRALGHVCETPGRGQRSDGELGHVVWCAGVTADFRQRPFDTVVAHVSDLVPLLQYARFESLLYVSSTRVYQHSDSAGEDARLPLSSADPSDLYNLSKLMGESICLHARRENVRVARLSNVYGGDFSSDNFLTQLIKSALGGKLTMLTGPDSAKDYVAVEDVVDYLARIALDGKHPIYNLAFGRNLDNRALAEALARITGCQLEWAAAAPNIRFPPISVARLQESFGATPPRDLLHDLDALVKRFGAAT